MNATVKPDIVALNLGCGLSILLDAINVDNREYPYWESAKEKGAQFVVANLNYRWPFDDNSADLIVAKDIFEHLHDKIHTMTETFRVLKPGGVVHIWVPTTDSRAAFADPTHTSFWNVNSFFYFINKKDPQDVDILYEWLPKFDLLAAKVFTYKNMADSRGIYVQLMKPVPQIQIADEATKESEETK